MSDLQLENWLAKWEGPSKLGIVLLSIGLAIFVHPLWLLLLLLAF